MAQQGGASGVKLLIIVLALGFAAYICGPPLYWHFVGDGTGKHVSCPVCICECPNDNNLADLANLTLPDCVRDDPDMQDELGKSRYQLLQEELKLQETVAEEAQQRSEAAILEAKKTASQFQKEFEKCNQGMETSEGAREKAEAALVLEKKKSELWERRARELGWKEDGEDKEKADDNETTEQSIENIENKEDEQKGESFQGFGRNLVIVKFKSRFKLLWNLLPVVDRRLCGTFDRASCWAS
ncbi:hypothetical protein R1flu_009362 [Riccia fluitans]|uniref:Uncharacterized protein n=1 Tax=Riccia fluitans TaxID=41844 RepID=A0ABD1Z1W1_9MARC